MLDLKIKNTSLDLHEKTSITIEMHNPIFDKESLARVFSYPFKLPATDRNLVALKHPTRIDSKGVRYFEGVKMYLDNLLFEIGVLEVNKVQEDIHVVFRNKAISALTQLEDKKLNEVLEVIDIPQIETAYYILKLTGPSWYTLNINSAPLIHFKQPGETTQDVIDSLIASINNPYYILATAEQTAPDQIRIAAAPNSDLLLNNMTGFELVEYKSSAEANLFNMTSYANEVVTEPVEQFALPVIHNPEHYSKNEIFFGYLNFWSDGTPLLNTGHDEKHWFHTYSPCPRIPYILNQIAKATDLHSVTGSFLEDEEIEQLLLFINKNTDRVTEEKDLIRNTMFWINGYSAKLDLNSFVPDKSAKQFLQDIMSQFCLYADVKHNQLHLTRKADQLIHTAIDWTKKVAAKPLRIFEEETGYTLDYDHPEEDRILVAGQMLPFQIGDGNTPVKFPFHTLHDYVHTYDLEPITLISDPHTWKIPAVTTNKELYALLLDRGIQKDNQDKEYPLAQHLNTDLQDQETGTTTLALGGQGGIYERYWKAYLPLLQADELTVHFRVSIVDILILKEWKNAKRRIVTPDGVAEGIVKSLSVKVSRQGISVAKVTLAKIA